MSKKLYIEKETIRDLMGVEIAEIECHNLDLIDLTGPNGSGKTTCFKAWEMALFGAAADPPEPIRQGKNSAEVVISLAERSEEWSGLMARLSFTRIEEGEKASASDKKRGYKRKLEVWDENGRISDGQAVLSKVTSALLFDPVEFIETSGQEQIELLMKSGAVKLPIKLAEHDLEYQRLYDERTAAGREADRLEQHAASLPSHAGELEPVDTSQAMKELEEAERLQRELDSVGQAVAEDEVNIQIWREDITKLHKQIQELENRIKKLESHREELIKEAKSIQVPDSGPLRQRLESAGEINAKVADNNRKAEANAQAKLARSRWQEFEDAVKANRAARKKAFAEAQMPAEGMDFGTDKKGNPCVLINKVPLAQVNTAEQVKVAMGVLIALKPMLRCAFVHAANDLDPEMRQLILEQAKAAGMACMFHTVTARGDNKAGFYFEDGQLLFVDGKPAKKKAKAKAKENGGELFEGEKDA